MAGGRFYELKVFLWYVFAVFRPGAQPPPHPHHKEHPSEGNSTTFAAAWSDDDFEAYLMECRRVIDQQQVDKRDVRSRSQVLLTTALILGSAIVADSASRHAPAWWIVAVYAAASACVLATILATAGLLTAQSPVGGPSLDYLEARDDGDLKRAVTLGYTRTRSVGAETVSLMVTALRDSTLALVVGFILGATAHFLP